MEEKDWKNTFFVILLGVYGIDIAFLVVLVTKENVIPLLYSSATIVTLIGILLFLFYAGVGVFVARLKGSAKKILEGCKTKEKLDKKFKALCQKEKQWETFKTILLLLVVVCPVYGLVVCIWVCLSVGGSRVELGSVESKAGLYKTPYTVVANTGTVIRGEVTSQDQYVVPSKSVVIDDMLWVGYKGTDVTRKDDFRDKDASHSNSR